MQKSEKTRENASMYIVSQFLNAGASQIDKVTNTGKFFSEALIPASTNPKYDKNCSLNCKFST